MERVSIHPLENGDIDFAYEMTVKEQWNVTWADVQRMFSYEPHGCFLAEVEGLRAGHVFTVNYGNLGWVGLLIVRAEHRKKGVASLLMQRAIEYLRDSGVKTINLDAVPLVADLYRKLGFVDEYDSLRFSGESRANANVQSDSASPIENKRIGEIARFDAAYFGADRTRVLMSLFRESPATCFLSYEGSQIVGYLMCRKALNGYTIGPFVCDPERPRAARGLLARCMEKLGSGMKVYVGVSAVNEGAIEILREQGFKQYSKSIRMRLGKKLATERTNGIFAIGGAMKG